MMLNGNCRNPNIVFGQWSPFETQDIFDLAVHTASFCITSQDQTAGGKVVDASQIFFCPRGFVRTIAKFTDHYAGDKDFVSLCQTILDRRLVCEQRNNDVRIQQAFTTHSRQPARNPVRWFLASLLHRPWELSLQSEAVA